MVRQNLANTSEAALTSWAYESVTQRARALAEQTLLTLERLRALYPTALPQEVVESAYRFYTGSARTGLAS